jgi:hypothetical protein
VVGVVLLGQREEVLDGAVGQHVLHGAHPGGGPVRAVAGPQP